MGVVYLTGVFLQLQRRVSTASGSGSAADAERRRLHAPVSRQHIGWAAVLLPVLLPSLGLGRAGTPECGYHARSEILQLAGRAGGIPPSRRRAVNCPHVGSLSQCHVSSGPARCPCTPPIRPVPCRAVPPPPCTWRTPGCGPLGNRRAGAVRPPGLLQRCPQLTDGGEEIRPRGPQRAARPTASCTNASSRSVRGGIAFPSIVISRAGRGPASISASRAACATPSGTPANLNRRLSGKRYRAPER